MSGGGIARAVLFDLDGTLVDTAPDLWQAANAVRARLALAPMPLDALRPSVSRGSRAMLAAALPHLAAEEREAWVEPFLEAYGTALAVHSRLFPGMAEVLAAIEASGARWGIVTNKPSGLAQGVIEGLGLADRCAVLVGGDTLPRRKPAPDPLHHACAALGLEARRAVYVGDDARDAEAARAAGMRCVAAAWGYRDAAEDLAAWGADAVLEHPHDLLRPGALACHAD